MAGVPPVKGQALTFWTALTSRSTTTVIKANPTLAAGDVKISKDGGAFATLGTLPDAEPDAGRAIRVICTSTEMNADVVCVQFADAVGAEWADQMVVVYTAAAKIGDAVTLATGAVTSTALAATAAAEIADAVWDEVATGHTTAGKAGTQLWTDVDAILADTGTDGVVLAANSVTSTALAPAAVTEIAAGITIPTAANIADAVWDEASTGHTDAGKAGTQVWTDIDAILADTGTDGVVLAADAITAAKIADDAIATEHIATGALTADSFAADSIAAAAVKADAVTKIQSGLATATALTTVDDLVDDLESRLTAARAGYLDNLSAGAVATAAALATVDGIVDAILLDTGTDGVLLATDALSAAALSTAAAQEIADAILTRDWTAVTGEAARSALNALRFLRNKWSISGTTLTVTEEDDTAAAWTAVLTTTTSTDGITAADPA